MYHIPIPRPVSRSHKTHPFRTSKKTQLMPSKPQNCVHKRQIIATNPELALFHKTANHAQQTAEVSTKKMQIIVLSKSAHHSPRGAQIVSDEPPIVSHKTAKKKEEKKVVSACRVHVHKPQSFPENSKSFQHNLRITFVHKLANCFHTRKSKKLS